MDKYQKQQQKTVVLKDCIKKVLSNIVEYYRV